MLKKNGIMMMLQWDINDIWNLLVRSWFLEKKLTWYFVARRQQKRKGKREIVPLWIVQLATFLSSSCSSSIFFVTISGRSQFAEGCNLKKGDEVHAFVERRRTTFFILDWTCRCTFYSCFFNHKLGYVIMHQSCEMNSSIMR